jgi:undecaprenyl-phosphate galactose phosphotransferase
VSENLTSLLPGIGVVKRASLPGVCPVKRVFDVLAASVGLVFLSPLLLLLYTAIRLSGAHALFGHARIGRHGQPFQCYKFRTMVPDADQRLNQYLAQNIEAQQEWAKDRKLRNDPRVTRLGKFLRKTSLDELPQLWNVIKGDMSLVGPRPVVYQELEMYGKSLPYYVSARPGLTGLWQVSGRNDTSYTRRVRLDRWYVRHQSLLLDMRIIARTIPALVRSRGAY